MNAKKAKTEKPKPQKYVRAVWSDEDPNDTFYVEGQTTEQAALAALEHLGWCLAADADAMDADEAAELLSD